MNEHFEEFRAELLTNIKNQIRSLRIGGTMGMSERNLLAVTPTPKARGPIGTNAAWVYRQMFNEVALTLPRAYRCFIDFSNDGRGQS